jgi:hypothetical protein
VISLLSRWYGIMKALRFDLDLIIVALVSAAFVAVAAQRLGTVPIPKGDEAFTLQVPESEDRN